MTQKELMYVEDAIGHERVILSLCEKSSEYLEDETLIAFMESEIKKHSATLKGLMAKLEECAE